MSDPTCGLPREWLVALRDGELHAAQLELTEAHLRDCARCRRWLSEMDETDRLLRDATPYQDNPAARAAIKARVADGEPTAPFGSASHPRRSRRTLALGIATLALVLAVVSAWRGPMTEAGDWFSSRMPDEPLEAPLAGTPIVAPIGTTGPVALPLGLAQAGDTEATAEYMGRYYRSESGLSILYGADCSDSARLPDPLPQTVTDIVGVQGVPVRVDYAPRRASIGGMYWIANETQYAIFVLSDSKPAMTLDDALGLVAALMARQEDDLPAACTG
jgi:hypothetical protein